jgi:hypothetical protein
MADILERQLGLTPEGADQGRAPLHRAQAVARTGFQITEVGGATVGECVILQLTPDVFRRIELGRIGRQLFDLHGAVQSLQVVAHHRRLAASHCSLNNRDERVQPQRSKRGGCQGSGPLAIAAPLAPPVPSIPHLAFS